MRFVKPSFYDRFRCVADRCPASCCEGWQILIDEETLERYRTWPGAFGGRLAGSIDWQEGAFRQRGRKCAFLHADGLCDIQTEAGEDALCETCRRYPRHVEEFEDVREYSLSLSCPEAARMILMEEDRLSLVQWETEETEIFEEGFDFLLYEKLLEAREILLEILQDEKRCFPEKKRQCLAFAGEIQRLLEDGDFPGIEEVIAGMREGSLHREGEEQVPPRFARMQEGLELLRELEYLDPAWEKVLRDAEERLFRNPEEYEIIYTEFTGKMGDKSPEAAVWDQRKSQIAVSFIYTYFCGAVYDDAVYSKVLFALFSAEWIQELVMAEQATDGEKKTEEDIVRMTFRYARETEHSDINLNLLEDRFWEKTHPKERFMGKVL